VLENPDDVGDGDYPDDLPMSAEGDDSVGKRTVTQKKCANYRVGVNLKNTFWIAFVWYLFNAIKQNNK
jgi:hypothetical protein